VRPALVIAGKDLLQRARDRSAFLVALVLPLALASIFGLILHDVAGGRTTFHYALVDADRGAAARAFESRALAPLERDGLLDVRHAGSIAEGRRLADRSTVAATFVIPAGFSAAVEGGRPARIDVLGDTDAPIGSLVAESIARAYGSNVDAVRVATAATGSSRPVAPRRAIAIADVSTQSKELDATTFYAAGMAVFFLFFTVQFGISSLFDERRDGTLARLLAAPVRRGAIVAGKLVTSVVIGTVSMVVLLVATSLLLGADWGNPLGVLLLIVAGVLAATAVMALVASVARTPDQAQSWQSMVALVLGMLGGSFFPIAQAGGVLAALSLASPHGWFLRGLQELSGGAGPGAAIGPAAALLAFATACGALAAWRVDKLVRP
jgi:linearmycin/streptolysin S transport system permease protein